MSLQIKQYTDPEFQLDVLKQMFQQYQEFLGIPLDFQNFDAELNSLPGKYSPPLGNLYLAYWHVEPVGCTAFYPMVPDICELKRLFVLPDYQGKAIGKQLMMRAMQDAKWAGYQTMRLDSLRRLGAAEKLYLQLGFEEIEPYNQNPHADVYYMARAL